MQALLARGGTVDAVFAASDLIAIGAMRACIDAGLRVPEDVAIVGFDDIPAAAFINPGLTTVSQDVGRAGLALVETLLAQIRNEPTNSRSLPTRLVIRKSCGS
jgi:DNA-binding LacI/PurR family transcriptional regulator